MNTFVSAKQRRLLRRGAERLRSGEAQPRYKNLFSAAQLADIYEHTIRRDEIRDQTNAEFLRIGREIGRALEEDGPAVRKTFESIFLGTLRSAKEQGPGSEAAQRHRQLQTLVWIARQYGCDRRRQRTMPRTAFRSSLPSSSSRRRVFLRIGIGEGSWIGSFEYGHKSVSTTFMLPDGKHLFVSVQGAGYIIDLKSRALVEAIGTEVAGVMRDGPMTLFIVDHDGMSLEAFGTNGRLWKTDTISSGGFRNMALKEDELVGEARPPSGRGWVRFSVRLATGEVRGSA